MSEKIILGDRAIYSSDCAQTGINNNVMVCGFSGSGKTMSICEPRLLETTESSLVVTVTKRRLVNTYRRLFEERGYKVIDLNFIDPERSDVRFDPLDYMMSDEDIEYFATSLIVGDGQKNPYSQADPYWAQAAASLFSAEIAHVCRLHPGAGLDEVLQFHSRIHLDYSRDLVQTSVDKEFREILEIAPDSFEARCWSTFVSTPIRTAGCIFSDLNSKIDRLFPSSMREMLRKKERLDIAEMGWKKTVLFVSTSSTNKGLQNYLNIFYGQVFRTLFHFADTCGSGRLPIGVHMICDDFASGGCIENFPEMISVFREKNISVTLLLQSESQLNKMYGREDATTIINNCNTYVYLGGMDLQTAKNVSIRANLPLEDVLSMPVGKEIIFRVGSRPLLTQRYPVLDHPVYQKVQKAFEEEARQQKSFYERLIH